MAGIKKWAIILIKMMVIIQIVSRINISGLSQSVERSFSGAIFFVDGGSISIGSKGACLLLVG